MNSEEKFQLFCELRGKMVHGIGGLDYEGQEKEGELTGFSTSCKYAFEISCDGDESWFEEIHPIKEPEYREWTIDTIPKPVFVRIKGWSKGVCRAPVSYHCEGIDIFDSVGREVFNTSYKELLKNYETLEGEPCGELVEGGEE